MENYTLRWRNKGGMRDIGIIDSELRLVTALRHAAQERGGPLPPIDMADALLDERRVLAEWPWYNGDIRPL